MNAKMAGFWLLARCTHPACDWQYRTQVKSDFDRAVKEHRAGHK